MNLARKRETKGVIHVDPIRQEIETVIAEIKKLVGVAQTSGPKSIQFYFQLAASLPIVMNTGVKFAGAPLSDKVEYTGDAIDELVGLDENAIVAAIPGLTPERTESLTDEVIEAAKEIALAKLQAAPA